MEVGRTKVMRAARFQRYGPVDVLSIDDVPVPTPGPGEVLVRIHASGLNPKDVMIRSGSLRLQTGRTFPRGTGFDFSGEVEATGPGVDDLLVGTRVWGFLDGVMGGAAAEYVVAPRSSVSTAPVGMGWLESAALPLAASAALQALRDVAEVDPGERVLVRGASGGVGSAAIQIARAMGAHVAALSRGGRGAHCRALGADEVVGDGPGASTRPGRYHVVLDCVGGGAIAEARRLLAPGGRWVAVAPDPTVFALSPLSGLLSRRFGLRRFGYVVVRPRASDLRVLASLASGGVLRMPVSAAYPLEHIREAHARVAEGSRGKRVLAVSAPAVAEAEALDGYPRMVADPAVRASAA